jgi:hypothetical protein
VQAHLAAPDLTARGASRSPDTRTSYVAANR